MIASTRVTIEPDGVLGAVSCEPPMTLRRVRVDDPSVCGICLVGTSAGPLGGDERNLLIEVTPGARATLRAAGASIAQGRPGGETSRLSTRVDVGRGATLDADPGPVVACAGSRVDVRLEIALAESASIYWREVLVLGRTGEASGQARLRWDVVRNGVALLRQSIDLADDRLSGWAGLLGGRRILATALLVGPRIDPHTVVESATGVIQQLGPQACLVTVLSDDAAAAARRLGRLCAAAGVDGAALD
jgi:urease accessory protein